MNVLRLGASIAVACVVGCGGGGGNGYGGTTAPPPPPPSGGGNQTLGSITTNVSTISIGAGATSTITVTAYDAQGQLIQNAGNPSFASANASVAEVNSTGEVLGLTSGSTQVTVSLTLGSVTKTSTVAVSVTGALPIDVGVVASSGDYVFTPKTVAIQKGGSVTWSFGSLEHTVTFTTTAGAPTNIPSGYLSSQSRTFTSAGDFTYVCTIHAGMSGKVVVR